MFPIQRKEFMRTSMTLLSIVLRSSIVGRCFPWERSSARLRERESEQANRASMSDSGISNSPCPRVQEIDEPFPVAIELLARRNEISPC